MNKQLEQQLKVFQAKASVFATLVNVAKDIAAMRIQPSEQQVVASGGRTYRLR